MINLNLNKSDLYKEISKKTNIKKTDIESIFKVTENIVFDFLSGVQGDEKRKVFVMNGISAQSEIVHYRQHFLPSSKKYTSEERILLTAQISKRYRDKINQNR